MGSPQIASLPPEILTAICSHLPRQQLKNVRLTSKNFNPIASAFLFRIAYLRVGIESFRHLQSIANDTSLCHHVRVISYDPWRMKNTSKLVVEMSNGSIDMFEAWKVYDLERGLRLSKLPEERLRPMFENWLARVADLEALSSSLELEMLIDIMSKLPMLNGLQYDLFARGELHIYAGGDLSAWEINTVANEKLPGKRRRTRKQGNQEDSFWTLLKAAHAAGRTDYVKKIKAADMDLTAWNSIGRRANPKSMVLPNLAAIDLQFEMCFMMDSPCLKRILVEAPLLQHLALSFNSLDSASYRSRRYVQLSDIVAQDQCWEHLKHVSLQHLATPDSEVRDFLERHNKSLRSLELKDILLHPGDSVNTTPDEEAIEDRKGNEEVGSWLDMIEFLRTSLSLERVRFGGILANGRNEAWKVSNPRMEIPRTAYTDYLKPRIEKYICDGGKNPIELVPTDRVMVEAPTDSKFDTRGLEIPYIWEDDSWRLSVVELPRVRDPNAEN
ncbi:hypothetical protein BKA65DRAFT_197328 [Rhexocercosporidium sp. MPI-PUGE-AT-0058]|nr:hypothetical protein BKA65DRAFT_197328 [Rhexocercosporidium sp. MPI-PUGE-AT-0058]